MQNEKVNIEKPLNRLPGLKNPANESAGFLPIGINQGIGLLAAQSLPTMTTISV